MTTRAYLGQIERGECVIQNKIFEMERLRHTMTSSTVTFKEVNVQVSSDKDRIGDTIAELAELEEEIKKLITEHINKRKHIGGQIDSIKDTNMYQVLFARYMLGKNLKKIATEEKYSYRQICRIHKKALAEFERIYEKEYKSL